MIDALPLTLFAPFSLGFLTSFVSLSGISGSHLMFHVAYGIIRPPVEKSRKVNFFQFLTFIVFVGDHEFWQDGSVHAFQSLLIAFVSDLL